MITTAEITTRKRLTSAPATLALPDADFHQASAKLAFAPTIVAMTAPTGMAIRFMPLTYHITPAASFVMQNVATAVASAPTASCACSEAEVDHLRTKGAWANRTMAARIAMGTATTEIATK